MVLVMEPLQLCLVISSLNALSKRFSDEVWQTNAQLSQGIVGLGKPPQAEKNSLLLILIYHWRDIPNAGKFLVCTCQRDLIL